MNHFPVSSSVLSSSALAALVGTQYALKDVSCTLLKTFVNDTYIISAEGKQFIFRVYTKGWRSELEIREEIRMIMAVHQANVGVSYPIMDTSGDYIQKIFAPEGDRFGVLFSHAAGEKKFNLSNDLQQSLGVHLAKLHQATLDMTMHRPEYDGVTMLVYAFEKIQPYLKTSADDEAFMIKTKETLLSEFKKIKTDNVRKGGVHLDFWPDNLHIDSDNQITVFDFDFCGNGFQIIDIAFYFALMQGLAQNEDDFNNQTEAFLKGYETVTTLTDEERRIIPLLGAATCFYYMGVQSDRFSTIFFNEEHLKRMINVRLKRWMRFHKMI
ncbi:phosphotransferase [Pseudochryseolinea flava]|uniref:Aminoglycoside phosphotransferase n=1 Tax=Pseudochryseolinea flava TaxID=2059302 RepID=A0A364XXM0_9BACT|nr:phosphotransferase [Pseudochryseolinea flava]RAV99003.1 aminoglycoside phosphotransferase [Pseudochryseolinea flava]